MKIAFLMPGFGGTFYCQNCLRDAALYRQLQKRGVEVTVIPMYMPLQLEGEEGEAWQQRPVFFGAIRTWLTEKFSFINMSGKFMRSILDSSPLLSIAASFGGSTDARGLEKMTLSLLQGKDGHQAREVERLARWLADTIKPDIVHISNCLLIGVARRIKEITNCKIVCSLQDEDTWIETMHPKFIDKIWQTIEVRATDVDMFFACSKTYARKMRQTLSLPEEKTGMVYPGLEVSSYRKSCLPNNPPTIVYLSRMNKLLGLNIIVDAFIKLSATGKFPGLKLEAMGGYTASDEKSIKAARRKLEAAGLQDNYIFHENFDSQDRTSLLERSTVLSVPTPKGEAFAQYIAEALCCGVPVVQPDAGAFRELVERTGGGIVVENTEDQNKLADRIAEGIKQLLSNRELFETYSLHGYERARHVFSIEKSAREIMDSYENILGSQKEQRHEYRK